MTAGSIFENMGNDGMISLGIIMATLGLILFGELPVAGHLHFVRSA